MVLDVGLSVARLAKIRMKMRGGMWVKTTMTTVRN